MKSQIVLVILLLLGATVSLPSSALAALATVTPESDITVSVLPASDSAELEIPRNESLEVKDAAYSASSKSLLALTRNGTSVVLSVTDNGQESTFDVTDYHEDVVEIEERPEKEKMTISVKDGMFYISQGALVAETGYEITVDPEKARVLLDGPSGKRFLSVSPKEATQTLLRANTLDTFSERGSIVIEEEENELAYKVEGARVINLFDLYEYPVDVTASVSALTGEIVNVDQPLWLQILGLVLV